MTKEQAKDFQPIIQAFAEGKPIQGMYLKGGYGVKYEDWDSSEPLDFENYSYRTKPESKLRPYTFEEMCEAVKKHGGYVKIHDVYVWHIVAFDEVGLRFYDYYSNYLTLAEEYVWLDDNSPCGVMEE